ncbi:hypothetical protein C8N25_11037 [Algoriphagus antarcticus]|uniref:Uncharacterized protein n=1 Tax=Algoriphagus antarcticus TaxID=238540 RepID=A0A3E0DXG7_9BACT|nr:hypothetical protein C8N25_11037 [Algoriphagus antarcticus]
MKSSMLQATDGGKIIRYARFHPDISGQVVAFQRKL